MKIYQSKGAWTLAYGVTKKADAIGTLLFLMRRALYETIKQRSSMEVARAVVAGEDTEVLPSHLMSLRDSQERLRTELQARITYTEDALGIDTIKTLDASMVDGGDCVSFAVAASAVWFHLTGNVGEFRLVGNKRDPHQHVVNVFEGIEFDATPSRQE